MIKIKLKKNKISVFLLLLVSAIFTNCFNSTGNGNTINSQHNVVNQSLHNSNGRIILGKKLEDPYTIEAMQEALDSLIANRNQYNQQQGLFKTVSQVPIIQTNYLYIRFLPNGKQQADYIQRRDKNLVLHPQPLDYEILQNGDFYIDSTLPDSVVGLYTVVPINYQFTDTVQYEILKEVFLIEPLLEQLAENLQGLAKTNRLNTLVNVLPNNTNLATTLSNLGVSLEQLEQTSLYLTHNLGDLFESSTELNTFLSRQQITSLSETNLDNVISWEWRRPMKWRPKGTIKYMDDVLNEQPVVGVRITIGRWYGWQSRHTNENGYFQGDRRYTAAKYSIHWDDDNFVLQDGGWELYGVVYIGHHAYRRGNFLSTFKSDWNVTLHGKEARFAVVYAAAEMYYYGDIDGLHRPRKDGFFTPRLDIECYNKGGEGFSIAGFLNIGENVEVYFKNDKGDIRPHDNLYGLTIHELSHQVLFEYTNVVDFFWEWDKLKKVITESHGMGIEWWITKKKYEDYQILRYPFNLNSNFNRGYTGIIQDLVDNDSLLAHRKGGISSLDFITNFTVKELEDIFFNIGKYDQVREQVFILVKNDTAGITHEIEEYLSDYFNWGFDSYNQNLWVNFKNRLFEMDKFIDSSFISTLIPDNLKFKTDSIFSNYFNNLQNLFNYWGALQ